MIDYDEYVRNKKLEQPASGFVVDESAINPMLFDYQRVISRWNIHRGRSAVFADCGLGKSVIEWQFCDAVAKRTGMPVLILAPLSVAEQMVDEAPSFGYTINLCESSADLLPGLNVSNYEKLKKFSADDLGGLVLDECFAQGTKIDIVHNDYSIVPTPIEHIRVGDLILNASGIDTVSDVHRRKIEYAIRVNINGESIVCSPNHPWFTQRGWRAAQDLEPTDKIMATTEAMRMVWESIFATGCVRSKDQAILQSILFSEMANEPAGTSGQGSHARCSGKAGEEEARLVSVWGSQGGGREGENQKYESDGESRNTQESVIRIESHEAQTFRAWGERVWLDCTSEDFVGCVGREMDSGICFVTGETNSGLSNMLQTRLSESRAKSMYRSGWALTSQQENARRQEGSKTGFAWVEGIEILEPGNPELEQFREEDGNIYFYDLGGTRHPSFSINGLLVHNSSILKAGTFGKLSTELVKFAENIPYRLAATATPAPNDLIEIAFHSEFLGIMQESEVKALFFTQDGNSSNKFRLKRNAVEAFYKWLATWAVALRKPSDLGFSDEGFELPELHIEQITIDDNEQFADGTLFGGLEAKGIDEQRKARKSSIENRAASVADRVNADNEQWLVWCDLNPESEALAKAVKNAIEVKGSDSPEHKIDAMLGFKDGRYQNAISKPSMWGFGLNFQNSHNAIFCGLGNSFERYYQTIKRQHRFGQKAKRVNVYVVVSPADGAVVSNIRRKWAQNDKMFDELVRHMAVHSDLTAANGRQEMEYNPQQSISLPAWLTPVTVVRTTRALDDVMNMNHIDLSAIPFQIDGELKNYWCGLESLNPSVSMIVPRWASTTLYNP